VNLGANDTLVRGAGYFLQPMARAVSQVKGFTNAGRIPTDATTFVVTLHRKESDQSATNGFNLIGFPFDPALYSSIDWLSSTVVGPDGTHYASIQAAAAAGLMTDELTTLKAGSNTDYQNDTTLVPF
jgi:hypothetical protein